jgi:hypothetical protein
MNQYMEVVLLLLVTVDGPWACLLELFFLRHIVQLPHALLPLPYAITLAKDAQNSYKNCEHG